MPLPTELETLAARAFSCYSHPNWRPVAARAFSCSPVRSSVEQRTLSSVKLALAAVATCCVLRWAIIWVDCNVPQPYFDFTWHCASASLDPATSGMPPRLACLSASLDPATSGSSHPGHPLPCLLAHPEVAGSRPCSAGVPPCYVGYLAGVATARMVNHLPAGPDSVRSWRLLTPPYGLLAPL